MLPRWVSPILYQGVIIGNGNGSLCKLWTLKKRNLFGAVVLPHDDMAHCKGSWTHIKRNQVNWILVTRHSVLELYATYQRVLRIRIKRFVGECHKIDWSRQPTMAGQRKEWELYQLFAKLMVESPKAPTKIPIHLVKEPKVLPNCWCFCLTVSRVLCCSFRHKLPACVFVGLFVLLKIWPPSNSGNFCKQKTCNSFPASNGSATNPKGSDWRRVQDQLQEIQDRVFRKDEDCRLQGSWNYPLFGGWGSKNAKNLW